MYVRQIEIKGSQCWLPLRGVTSLARRACGTGRLKSHSIEIENERLEATLGQSEET
jgi:hypothetical protein